MEDQLTNVEDIVTQKENQNDNAAQNLTLTNTTQTEETKT